MSHKYAKVGKEDDTDEEMGITRDQLSKKVVNNLLKYCGRFTCSVSVYNYVQHDSAARRKKVSWACSDRPLIDVSAF